MNSPQNKPEENPKTNFEPGGARLGNFINYYQFNPAEKRLEFFKPGFWRNLFKDAENDLITVLDIGCNTGVSRVHITSDPCFRFVFVKKNPKTMQNISNFQIPARHRFEDRSVSLILHFPQPRSRRLERMNMKMK